MPARQSLDAHVVEQALDELGLGFRVEGQDQTCRITTQSARKGMSSSRGFYPLDPGWSGGPRSSAEGDGLSLGFSLGVLGFLGFRFKV